jgi:hypothetical protein
MTQDTGRFDHWKQDAPPPPARWQRWLRTGSATVAVAAALGIVLYGVVWLFDKPSEEAPAKEPRADFGYFPPSALRPGDCFGDKGIEAEVRRQDESGIAARPFAMVVPCERPHSAEVFHVIKVATDPTPPSDEEIEQEESDACNAALSDYADPSLLSQVEVWYWGVSAEERQYDGHPQVVCFAVNESGRRTRGSIADPPDAPA